MAKQGIRRAVGAPARVLAYLMKAYGAVADRTYYHGAGGGIADPPSGRKPRRRRR